MGRKKSLRNAGKFILRTEREPNRQGEYPVYIQYTLDGKVARGETGVCVKEKDWDASKQRVRSTHRMATKLNQVLDEKKLYIDTEVLLFVGPSSQRITIDILRRIVQGKPFAEEKPEVDFIQFMRDNQKRRHEVGKIAVSTHENGDNTIGGFREFLKEKLERESIFCSEVTVKLISDYIVWRLDERGNKPATINKALTPIMKACKAAAIEELMNNRTAEAIGELYLTEKRSLTNDEDEDNHSDHYLTEEKLQEMADLYPLQLRERSREYMDMWFLSLHTCGLRFSDILTLQWCDVHFDERMIRKVVVKTKRQIEIPLTDNAIELLKRFWQRNGNRRFVCGLLPENFDLNDDLAVYHACLHKNASIKTCLKRIGKLMDLPFNLGMHCARHTFAVLALSRGIEVKKLSVLMGHSSVLVTEKTYARFIPHILEQEVNDKLQFEVIPRNP